ncbi:MAG: TIM barrel protein [Bryobacterales bacterium]|nr:TIM barrel protein [Bryobacterales bacterium]
MAFRETGISRRQAMMTAATAAALTQINAAEGAQGRTTLGTANDSVPSRRGITTLDFIDLVNGFGMGGAQVQITTLEPAYARQVREKLEKSGLFFIANASINDVERFRQTVAMAKEAGAVGIRVASGGRRYEDFSTLAERQAHLERVLGRIVAAVPIAEAARIPIALENHKDFTIDEQVALHQRYSSEYFGACIDTGNNLALLDDPMEVIERLSPYAVTAHLKDATLEEYEEGFLLGDIPLGEGFFDLPKVVATLRKHKPNLPLLLECITRNPLKIPCLSDKYWATFPERNGLVLARALRLVRANKPKWQMQVPANASPEQLRAMETKHVEMSVACARGQLGLV